MDSKLLLIKVITLLFLESQLSKKSNLSSRNIATAALSFIKTPDAAVLTDFSRDSLGHLLEIARWMIGTPVTEKFDKADILQRVRMATET